MSRATAFSNEILEACGQLTEPTTQYFGRRLVGSASGLIAIVALHHRNSVTVRTLRREPLSNRMVLGEPLRASHTLGTRLGRGP